MGLEPCGAGQHVLSDSSLMFLYFMLIWRGNHSARVTGGRLDDVMLVVYSFGPLFSLRRVSHIGTIFSAQFKPLLGK